MLPFLAYLLLTASALASPYRGDIPYDGSLYPTSTDSYPIDYNDDFRTPAKNPNSNIYFSFEQIRRDQTSQVDVREEDVGRYLYRPKVTSTTTSAPALVKSRNPIIIPDVYMPSVQYNHHWVDPSTTMAPPPSAPSPKWEGFDLDFKYSPYSQYKAELRIYEYVLKPKTTMAPATRSSGPNQAPVRSHIQPIDERHTTEETTTSTTTTTTIQPHWTEKVSYTKHPMVNTHSEVSSRRNSSRGSHKFNWREPVGPAERTHPIQRMAEVKAAQAPVTAPMSPALPALKRPPPPPVPALTPWSGDNF